MNSNKTAKVVPDNGDSREDNTHEFQVPVYWVAVLNTEDVITTDEIEQITGHPAFARGTRAELDPEKHYPNLLRDVILGRAD